MRKNNKSIVAFTCHDGHKWLACCGDIMKGRWCATCRQSEGAKRVMSILDKMGVKYEPEIPLKGTKLKADFFIEPKNLIIEFDGEQHFSQEWGCKKKPDIRVNDLRKNAWCLEHKVHLLRIPWWTGDVEKTILDAIAGLSSDKLLTPPEDYYGLAPLEDISLDD